MTRTNRPVMAEMLVRHVFGEAANFERLCEQRGVTVEQAVEQALLGWVGHGLSVVQKADLDAEGDPVVLLLPDPAECPHGQEAHWLDVIEHDLSALRRAQQRCFKIKDTVGLQRTNQSIETYIQAQATLRDRVA